MPNDAPVPVVRFAVFEVDRRSGELRKRGVRISLRDQAFQVLSYLLERPGEVVTRDELQRRLWHADTFVDFDRGLNKAVNRLREALGDSADVPRFIETLPKRGYRFIAPIESVATAEAADAVLPVAAPTDDAVRPAHSLRWLVVAALVVTAGVVATSYALRSRHPQAPVEPVRVVLADFDNHTGDHAFDDTLKQALAIDLEQSPTVRVVSDDEVGRTLRLMHRRPDDPLTTTVARDVCRRSDGNAVLGGSLTMLNSEYVLGLNAIDCRTGEVVAREQIRAVRKEDVLGAVDDATVDLRRRLGESATSIPLLDKHVHEMLTTVSLDAFQAYTNAERKVQTNGGWSAIPLFEHAIDIDPDFAYAHAAVALVLGTLGESARSEAHAKRAYQLRDHVSEWERFFITVQYNDRVTGEIEKNLPECDLWIQAYPQERTAHNRLAVTYNQLGQPARALLELEQARRFGHEHPIDIDYWTGTATRLDRAQDAAALVRQVLERTPDRLPFRHDLYRASFVAGDVDGMAAQVEWARHALRADAILIDQSDTEAYFGRVQKGRALLEQAIAAALRNDFRGNAAVWSGVDAVRDALFGDVDEARRRARAALATEDGWETQALAAMALARAGFAADANDVAAKLSASRPAGTLVQNYWLPAIRAEIELRAGHAARAVDLLRSAEPYELADTRVPLLPAYVRGEAYLQARDGAAAAIEFRKLVDHRGAVGNSALGALARLGLARALRLVGDNSNARKEYELFLASWRDADSTLPVLAQAKFEYAVIDASR
jgi:eukaryotic-like serine/threonine-protein kinase